MTTSNIYLTNIYEDMVSTQSMIGNQSALSTLVDTLAEKLTKEAEGSDFTDKESKQAEKYAILAGMLIGILRVLPPTKENFDYIQTCLRN